MVRDSPAAGWFEILVEDQVTGFAAHHRNPDTVSFTRTVIEPDFEGRGPGSILARAALDAARAQGAAVLRLCPFIGAHIQRHLDYVDLVPADRRPEFGLDTVLGARPS